MNAHIAIARVAGYDAATFGLPEGACPILFERPNQNALIATTALSHLVRGRYGPTEAFAAIWERILQWLAPEMAIPELRVIPAVRPTFPRGGAIPASTQRDAFGRAMRWFTNSRLLIHESWLPYLAPAFSAGTEDGAMLPSYLPLGDGRDGMLEGFSSQIAPDGSQRQRYVIRNDCLGESAMAFAFDGRLNRSPRSGAVSRNLADYVCFDSLICQGVRADPSHPTYGLMAWGVTSWAWERAFYGDDNARALLGLLATASLSESGRWDETMLRALLANLRTTGPLGFRGDRIDVPDLEQNGWRAYAEREIVNPSPHYEAYLWACYLWAYRATGYEPFLTKAEAAIRRTMEAYPDNWRLTYGLTLDRSRMLLCLAWLVRVAGTPEHRDWLMRVARDLIATQQPCGAIPEVLGNPAHPQPPAVPSNEAYGTAETPLIQENGDPACDMLYSLNFAFLGLHEAVAATGEPELARAEDRLAEFLCRIQVRSETHPELDGAWFRSFDHEKWDFWGSSADIGWGAWCIESGWSQAWITVVLGLRVMDTNLWDMTASSRIGDHLDRVLAQLSRTPDGPYTPSAERIEHVAVGVPVSLASPPDPRYTGPAADLTDGRAWPGAAYAKWQGWYEDGLCATVDLGRPRRIAQAGGRFLQNTDVGIFLPEAIRVSVSDDGTTYREAGSITVEPLPPGDRHQRAVEILATCGCAARYVCIEATSIATMPDWHFARGAKAWLFVDELLVR